MYNYIKSQEVPDCFTISQSLSSLDRPEFAGEFLGDAKRSDVATQLRAREDYHPNGPDGRTLEDSISFRVWSL
jgi:hypothetical protein